MIRPVENDMSKKILVVDDKAFMIRLIQHHLEKAGYQLINARNRQEAIVAMEQQSPELVVMDDHSKTCEPVTLTQSAHPIPTIRMTDVPRELDENASSNADVILTKPFSPTQLVAEVKRLVHETNPK